MKNYKVFKEARLAMLDLIDQFPFLEVAIDMNDDGRTLVSYLIKKEISSDDTFWDALLEIEDDLTEKYGEVNILFCEDESLFKMTGNAQYLYGIRSDEGYLNNTYHFDSNVEDSYSTKFNYYMAA